MSVKKFIQVGTGGFGAYWCETIIPRIQNFAIPVAAVDINETALQNAILIAGIPKERCYTDIKVALAEVNADFAIVVVPPHLHEPIINEIFDAGIDVLCEKPLGHDMESSMRIYQKAKVTGRKIAVTMSHRFEVEKQTVESLVNSGMYGKLNYVYSRLNTCRNVASTKLVSDDPVVSMLLNGMIHNLDTVRGICGSNVKTIYANGWTSSLKNMADASSAVAILEMENGTRAILEESFANATQFDGWSDEYLRAECSYATIIADHRRVTVSSDIGYPYPQLAEIPLLRGEYWDHSLIAHDFVRWLDGGHPPKTNLDDNILCCAMTFAAIKSAVTGQVINVKDFMKRYSQ